MSHSLEAVLLLLRDLDLNELNIVQSVLTRSLNRQTPTKERKKLKQTKEELDKELDKELDEIVEDMDRCRRGESCAQCLQCADE